MEVHSAVEVNKQNSVKEHIREVISQIKCGRVKLFRGITILPGDFVIIIIHIVK